MTGQFQMRKKTFTLTNQNNRRFCFLLMEEAILLLARNSSLSELGKGLNFKIGSAKLDLLEAERGSDLIELYLAELKLTELDLFITELS
jgi:hypothetical protein